MTSRNDTTAKLIDLVEPICADSGYELVDLEYVRGPQGWVVRLYIDYADSAAGNISFADCETLSREVGAVLDVDDLIPHAYNLEVSSPGVERPLRTAEHFRRFIGETAKISLEHGLDGRRNFKGVLLGVEVEDGAEVVAIDVDGSNFSLPLADVATARLVPDWDALMKEAQGKGPSKSDPDGEPRRPGQQ